MGNGRRRGREESKQRTVNPSDKVASTISRNRLMSGSEWTTEPCGVRQRRGVGDRGEGDDAADADWRAICRAHAPQLRRSD